MIILSEKLKFFSSSSVSHQQNEILCLKSSVKKEKTKDNSKTKTNKKMKAEIGNILEVKEAVSVEFGYRSRHLPRAKGTLANYWLPVELTPERTDTVHGFSTSLLQKE